jgi:rhodanese-related sulfurtransferase
MHNPGFLALVAEAKKRVEQMDIGQYRELRDPHVLVDVREDNEWHAGHALGSMHLSKGIIERDIETAIPDKETKLVLYCGGGYRSALAADVLRTMGYTRVISLDGGWKAYEAAGLPVEK